MSPVERTLLGAPADVTKPLFVYGLLKPGMPGHKALKDFLLYPPQPGAVSGELYVRDGLPLLKTGMGYTHGFLLTWHPDKQLQAYRYVCDFEPPQHYQWETVTLDFGAIANTLVARYPNKGNAEPLGSTSWSLADDPAFGQGLAVIRSARDEISARREWSAEEQFFRAQMAYLLLWAIVERLAALSFGPALDPNERVKKLHELPGMANLVREVVARRDRVTDSRDPTLSVTLNPENPKSVFQYYYRVRSNLSHRGKAQYIEAHKVRDSLDELLQITERFLHQLHNSAGCP